MDKQIATRKETPKRDACQKIVCRSPLYRPSTLMANRYDAYHGFTLVELLVVIGIISILAAMLLPVLSETRWTANKISSLNNLKQINQAVISYVDNHDSWVPNTVRADQGSNYWVNFYIIVYPTNLVHNTIGHTLPPYVDDHRIFMAPNHWDRLKNTYRLVGGLMWKYWYGWYWLGKSYPWYRITSYAYLPLLGYANPPKPTMRLGSNHDTTPFNKIALFQEVVTMEWRDADMADGQKSVNYRNGCAEGGSVLWGDGSANWVARSGFCG